MARTRRQKLAERLAEGPMTVKDLAATLGLRVKDVVDDLEHVRRSARGNLKVKPAECESCGLVFTSRRRLTAPSRCPHCRSERTTEPLLWME
jgi:hypothetical protein